MTTRTNNSDMGHYVQMMETFTNNNQTCMGEWATPNLYVVYSYGYHWPLLAYDTTTKDWYENKDRFITNQNKPSVTTTRHLTHCRRYLPTTTPLSCEDMKTPVARNGMAGLIADKLKTKEERLHQ